MEAKGSEITTLFGLASCSHSYNCRWSDHDQLNQKSMLNVTEGNSFGVWLLEGTVCQARGLRTPLLSTQYTQDTSGEMKAIGFTKIMRRLRPERLFLPRRRSRIAQALSASSTAFYPPEVPPAVPLGQKRVAHSASIAAFRQMMDPIDIDAITPWPLWICRVSNYPILILVLSFVYFQPEG